MESRKCIKIPVSESGQRVPQSCLGILLTRQEHLVLDGLPRDVRESVIQQLCQACALQILHSLHQP